MASIMRLPEELLISILSFLDLPLQGGKTNDWSRGDVRPTLCALAVTCKRLSDIVRDFLLQDVKLATGYVSSFSPVYTTDRLRNFARTCNESTDAISRIKSLQMQSDFSATPDWGASKDDEAPNRVLQAVHQSSSLEHLSILLPGARYLQWLPSLFPDRHKGKLFTGLKYLYLNCADTSIPPLLFLCMCYLPSIKQVECPSPIEYVPLRHGLLRSFIERSISPVEGCVSRLEIINSTNMSSSSHELYQLLDKMPELKELYSSLPGLGLAFDDRDGENDRTYSRISDTRSFSPLEQQVLLNPVAKTLRSLSMTSPYVLIRGHDGSLLDLSHFHKLEHLKLSIHFLCPASLSDAHEIAQADSIPCKPNKDLCHLLPPNLRTLEIQYDSYQGIFYDPHHLYTVYHMFDDLEGSPLGNTAIKARVLHMMYNELWTDRISKIDGKDSVRDRLDWLFALVPNKNTVLPRLVDVTIRETYARGWVWRDLDLVEVHPDLFCDQPSTMKVILRIPEGWNPPTNPERKQ